ncbi:hypothetical protein CONCODRAFT_2778 [Conidiobolus coronatus NRRL 28638]|uniref:Transmembrane protein n=1 Tax=Conidiobolus coronatus (strain ATCC 28846 / CBS 209.66 / NRRL 28638) TaxID=796925 RepID=A0A137PGX9_CONC2|nr:hypothetical protein CONCODRAFT_2778 [Conidiobolus coronatus NRRL 28638]|eukprot:KXN74242.1 hypothetical protein CONCODRAFT_2778 [Conidiobolus coronatus NRRL 28638]
MSAQIPTSDQLTGQSVVPAVLTTTLSLLYESNLTMSINAMSTTMFLGNTIHSLNLLRKAPKPFYLLNFIQSFLGLLVNLFIIGYFFEFNKNCEFRIYFAAVGNLISTTCIELILLLKSRVVSNNNAIVFWVGLTLEAARVSIGIYNIIQTTTNITPLYNCGAVIQPLAGALVVGSEILVNGYLTIVFLVGMYRQWKFIKKPFYVTLMQDGLIYSILTVLISILALLLAIFQALGNNSMVLFNVSWVVASSLTVSQLRRAFKERGISSTGGIRSYPRTNEKSSGNNHNGSSNAESGTYNMGSSNGGGGSSSSGTGVGEEDFKSQI